VRRDVYIMTVVYVVDVLLLFFVGWFKILAFGIALLLCILEEGSMRPQTRV
jgi:hypothetical protein